LGERNFCTLFFSGRRGSRQVTLRVYNTAGAKLGEHRIAEEALR
jgi:hypothetical protein